MAQWRLAHERDERPQVREERHETRVGNERARDDERGDLIRLNVPGDRDNLARGEPRHGLRPEGSGKRHRAPVDLGSRFPPRARFEEHLVAERRLARELQAVGADVGPFDGIGHQHLARGLTAARDDGGEAVAERVIEAEGRHQRRAAPRGRLAVALEDLTDERLLARGVHVVRPGGDRGLHEPIAQARQRACAVDDDAAAGQQPRKRALVLHGRGHPLHVSARRLCQLLQLAGVAPSQPQAAPHRSKLGRDEAAEKAGGRVDGDARVARHHHDF